jgi:hypothetical protein
VLVVSAAVLWVPVAANAPVQPPAAVHDVAFVEFQVNVVDSPLAIEVADALREAVGAAGLP